MRKAIGTLVGGLALAVTAIAAIFVVGMRKITVGARCGAPHEPLGREPASDEIGRNAGRLRVGHQTRRPDLRSTVRDARQPHPHTRRVPHSAALRDPFGLAEECHGRRVRHHHPRGGDPPGGPPAARRHGGGCRPTTTEGTPDSCGCSASTSASAFDLRGLTPRQGQRPTRREPARPPQHQRAVRPVLDDKDQRRRSLFAARVIRKRDVTPQVRVTKGPGSKMAAH